MPRSTYADKRLAPTSGIDGTAATRLYGTEACVYV